MISETILRASSMASVSSGASKMRSGKLLAQPDLDRVGQLAGSQGGVEQVFTHLRPDCFEPCSASSLQGGDVLLFLEDGTDCLAVGLDLFLTVCSVLVLILLLVLTFGYPPLDC